MNQFPIIYDSVLKGNFKNITASIEAALSEGTSPQELLDSALIPAMEEIGRRFEQGIVFVPEMLLAARTMKTALELLKPLMRSGESREYGTVAIGTVKGDLHDIGKNLVAAMLEGVGFRVINLGTDVSCEKFIRAIEEEKADIICMSALLTTTMVQMEEIIAALNRAGLRNRVKIMVGGAPVSEAFARRIGADGYSENANAATLLAKQLISA